MARRPLASTPSRRQFVTGAAGAMIAGTGAYRVAPTVAQDATPAATPMPQPDMMGAVYPFSVGAFACLAVSDGAGTSPDTALFLFAATPPERVEEVLAATRTDPAAIVNHHTANVIDTGADLVLVDTGFGPGISPTDGLLLDNLASQGIAPEDVDVVIITHGHPDHIGGNVDANGNPVFLNARYVMSEEDWDFWTDRARVEEMIPIPDFRELLLGFVDRQLLPLEGQIELIGYDEEIVPGITSVAAQGHTPGHMALRVESDGETLWIAGDLALMPLNLPYPDLLGLPDVEPERLLESRQRLFGQMAEDGGLVAFYHFDPFPSVGHVVAQDEAWRWEPIPDAVATPAG